MRQETDLDMRLEIQKNLASIYDMSLKIKRELEAIENLVCKNGCLNTAMDNANKALSDLVRDTGIKIQPTNGDGNLEEMPNEMIPITSDCITKGLMNIMHSNNRP